MNKGVKRLIKSATVTLISAVLGSVCFVAGLIVGRNDQIVLDSAIHSASAARALRQLHTGDVVSAKGDLFATLESQIDTHWVFAGKSMPPEKNGVTRIDVTLVSRAIARREQLLSNDADIKTFVLQQMASNQYYPANTARLDEARHHYPPSDEGLSDDERKKLRRIYPGISGWLMSFFVVS